MCGGRGCCEGALDVGIIRQLPYSGPSHHAECGRSLPLHLIVKGHDKEIISLCVCTRPRVRCALPRASGALRELFAVCLRARVFKARALRA